jgi:YebC/PmpR family DNA-binding regulatory protein
MGRAWEYRKARKFKRWDAMAKNFTRAGREIALAVKGGGNNPEANPRLRMAIQNAKNVQMPKERIEASIKKASSKDEGNFEEIVYEGHAPYGIAVMVECATDNPTRTVANIRMYFNKGGGALGTSGSVGYSFERKGIFKIEKDKINLNEVELDLIDNGAGDIYEEDDIVYIETSFNEFGSMQKKLDDLKIEFQSAELIRIPQNKMKLNKDQQMQVYNLIEKIEEDEDVVNVFHNMEEEEE